MNDRLAQLGLDADPTTAPPSSDFQLTSTPQGAEENEEAPDPKDDPEYQEDADPDPIPDAPEIPPVNPSNLEDRGGKALATMDEIDESGGFDPVADLLGVGAGLYTLFSGLHSADKVKPPAPPPMSLPSFQLGVN